MPSEERTYLSCDTVCPSDNDFGAQYSIHTPEFLNTIKSSGIPNHEIRLKVGDPIILLRNLDPSDDMCNGTRLVVTQMSPYILQARIILGANVGEKNVGPKAIFKSFRQYNSFQILKEAVSNFSILYNDSQGQSLKHVGIFLPRPVFSHGQLYVAISRVTTRKGLKIMIQDEDEAESNKVTNVVYKEAFQNLG